MKLTEFTCADLFLRRVGHSLEQNEAANNLILGLLLALRDKEQAGESIADNYMYMVEGSKGNLELVVLLNPLNLLLASPERAMQAIELCVDHLTMTGRSIRGVVGPNDLATPFSTLWADRSKLVPILAMNQRIYRLDRVEWQGCVPGELRLADESDVELVADWHCSFLRDIGEHTAADKAVQKVREHIKHGTYYLWVDGVAVSMAKSARPSVNGVVVTNVFTPPPHRGKGYATACVAALSGMLLNSGYSFCSLYTDLSNPTSNSIYTKIGYKPVQDSLMYRFGTGN